MDNDDQRNDDNETFRRQMKDVKRIRSDKHDLKQLKKKPKAKRSTQPQTEEQESLPYLRDEVVSPISGEAKLLFSRDGISEQLLRRLKRGKIPIQAQLDLHGATVVEAQEILVPFLQQHQRPDQTCVLIVHGKGMHGDQPILKNRINNWLRQCEEVLAFSSAKPEDGGAGAVYVLLKRLR